MERTCLYCKHINTIATGSELESCPKCDRIYSRVEANIQEQQRVRHAQAAARVVAQRSRFAGMRDMSDFVDELRFHSLYPTMRQLVAVVYWVMMGVAALIALSALIAGFKVHMGAFVMGVVTAALIVVAAQVIRESCLMVADLTDATIYMATQQCQQQHTNTNHN